MSEKLIEIMYHDIKTLGGAQMEALKLFRQIESHHGRETTQAIFRELGKPLSKSPMS